MTCNMSMGTLNLLGHSPTHLELVLVPQSSPKKHAVNCWCKKGWLPFLSRSQQCQSTDGTMELIMDKQYVKYSSGYLCCVSLYFLLFYM